MDRFKLAKVIVLLTTEGSVSPAVRTWRISFSNRSEILIQEFIKSFSNCFDIEPKTLTGRDGVSISYCYSTQIAHKLLKINLSYRVKSCIVKPVCPKLRGLNKKPCLRCQPLINKNKIYPPTKLPKLVFDLPVKQKLHILKILASTEGHLIFSKISGRRPNEYARRIEISSFHPFLLEQYKRFVKLCGFRCSTSNNRVVISGKENLSNFDKQVGFFPDVLIRKGTKWRGITKQELLKKILASYVK